MSIFFSGVSGEEEEEENYLKAFAITEQSIPRYVCMAVPIA